MRRGEEPERKTLKDCRGQEWNESMQTAAIENASKEARRKMC